MKYYRRCNCEATLPDVKFDGLAEGLLAQCQCGNWFGVYERRFHPGTYEWCEISEPGPKVYEVQAP